MKKPSARILIATVLFMVVSTLVLLSLKIVGAVTIGYGIVFLPLYGPIAVLIGTRLLLFLAVEILFAIETRLIKIQNIRQVRGEFNAKSND